MTNYLRITPNEERPRIFQCPNCKETINTSAQHCPFCSIAIDRRAAEAAADLMVRVNLAISQAFDLTRSVPPNRAELLLVGFLPRLWVFAISRPVMALEWWLRFAAIPSDHPDFVRAKRDVRRTARVSAIVLLVLLILFVLAVMVESR